MQKSFQPFLNPKYYFRMPNWVHNLNKLHASLIITPDLDSLFGASVLCSLFPRQFHIAYFYDFRNLYKLKNAKKSSQVIGIDCDLINMKCIGNHALPFFKDDYWNRESANLNVLDQIVYASQYYQKHYYSTSLLICSLLGLSLDELTPKAWQTLIAIDSVYTAMYSSNQQWVEKQETLYNEILGYPQLSVMQRTLMDVEKSLRQEEGKWYRALIRKHSLHDRIVMVNNKLKTSIDLDTLNQLFAPWNVKIQLPSDEFEHVRQFSYHEYTPLECAIKPKNGIFSAAWLQRNKVVLSKVLRTP